MQTQRLPHWFSKPILQGKQLNEVRELLSRLRLHTVCQDAKCPNLWECFCKGTATFMIMGNICTRHCTFCAVGKGVPNPLDGEEPQHILEAAARLELRHIVITSVTRDDLADGGASHFAKVIKLLHEKRDGATVEVLIPDFLGFAEALQAVVGACPEVINHNVETVPRLYHRVRPEADYNRSLELLRTVKRIGQQIVTKSGLMLGLGETRDEVIEVLRGLREANCDLLTIGQYLQPSPSHHPVARFVSPEEFLQYEQMGRDMGFAAVASAPLVRSSFKAAKMYTKVRGT